jgi:hypothetical protein
VKLHPSLSTIVAVLECKTIDRAVPSSAKSFLAIPCECLVGYCNGSLLWKTRVDATETHERNLIHRLEQRFPRLIIKHLVPEF